MLWYVKAYQLMYKLWIWVMYGVYMVDFFGIKSICAPHLSWWHLYNLILLEIVIMAWHIFDVWLEIVWFQHNKRCEMIRLGTYVNLVNVELGNMGWWVGHYMTPCINYEMSGALMPLNSYTIILGTH